MRLARRTSDESSEWCGALEIAFDVGLVCVYILATHPTGICETALQTALRRSRYGFGGLCIAEQRSEVNVTM